MYFITLNTGGTVLFSVEQMGGEGYSQKVFSQNKNNTVCLCNMQRQSELVGVCTRGDI